MNLPVSPLQIFQPITTPILSETPKFYQLPRQQTKTLRRSPSQAFKCIRRGVDILFPFYVIASIDRHRCRQTHVHTYRHTNIPIERHTHRPKGKYNLSLKSDETIPLFTSIFHGYFDLNYSLDKPLKMFTFLEVCQLVWFIIDVYKMLFHILIYQ